MKAFSTAMFLFCSAFSIAQIKHDYVWLFGSPTDDSNSKFGINILNFDNNNLDIEKNIEIQTNFFLTNASMSDVNGNLLYYSNGCFIIDSGHNLMENGEILNPGGMGFYENACPDGYTIPNGIISLPIPEKPDEYILIHQAGTFNNTPPFAFANRLLYTTIDMNMSLGKGKVIDKNQLILMDTFQSELAAVKHENNVDWWILTSREGSSKYFKILLTENGIESYTEQNIGQMTDKSANSSGQSLFSPDGTKYARINRLNQVYLFDFDRSNGYLSNFNHIIATDSVFSRGGVAFSPNNRFLYVSTQLNIYQYDLWETDIEASKVEVGAFDGFFEDGFFPITFYLMQLGPDCRIYIIAPNSSSYMHVIHNPNEKGLACNFEQRGIKLPGKNPISQPNFPNYRLGTDYPVCDSNIVLTSSRLIFPSAEVIKLYPNPASDILNVELFEPFRKKGEMILYNQTGQAVRSFELERGESEFRFSVSELVSGMYFYRISEGGILRKSGKVIVQK